MGKEEGWVGGFYKYSRVFAYLSIHPSSLANLVIEVVFFLAFSPRMRTGFLSFLPSLPPSSRYKIICTSVVSCKTLWLR